MPSSHLILGHPLLLLPPIPPSIRVFSNESTLLMRWPKYWSFSFSIIPSKEIPGLISFRMDWLDLLAVQGTLKSLLQHRSSKASIFWCSAFFTVQLSHPYMTTGKTIALTCEELTHWKRLWCWEGLGAGGEEDGRGWDGWMASLTRWTRVWVNSGSWWWTGGPGVLRFMGSQRVGHDWVTELNWWIFMRSMGLLKFSAQTSLHRHCPDTFPPHCLIKYPSSLIKPPGHSSNRAVTKLLSLSVLVVFFFNIDTLHTLRI